MAVRLAAVTTLCLMLSFAARASETYAFDAANTQISFTWSHFGRSVPPASFTGFSGTLVVDRANPAASSVDVTIDVGTLRTGFALLTPIMKSASFFDAADHPDITFRSTSVRPVDATHVQVHGELTIKGITHPVVLDTRLVNDAQGTLADDLRLRATATVLRPEWDLGGKLPFTSNEVEIVIQSHFRAGSAQG